MHNVLALEKCTNVLLIYSYYFENIFFINWNIGIHRRTIYPTILDQHEPKDTIIS